MNVCKPLAREAAFTRTDLLFVLLPLVLLAVIVLPALAGVQNKGGRLQCANNLRQIGQDSMIYASENNGWLPICTLGAANGQGTKTNFLGAMHYTRYVFSGATPNTRITTNASPSGGGNGYQNVGYLFQAGLAGNGSIFYCPDNWGGPLGASSYEPLLTADSTGAVRSSYLYNPRVANPNIYAPSRRYQKASQLEPHRLFGMDYILTSSSSLPPFGEAVTPSSIEHIHDRGWNVLFTDGSVQFSRMNNLYYQLILAHLTDDEDTQSFQAYDQAFNVLEQDH